MDNETGLFKVTSKEEPDLTMFGVLDEVDPMPEEVKVDFELEDEIGGLIDEGNTLDELKKVVEVAIKLRKEEELRLCKVKNQQLKDEAMKAELAAQVQPHQRCFLKNKERKLQGFQTN